MQNPSKEIPNLTTVKELADAIINRIPKFSVGKYDFELISNGGNTAEYNDDSREIYLYFMREGLKAYLGIDHGKGGVAFKSVGHGEFKQEVLEDLDGNVEHILDKISPDSTLEFVIGASKLKTQY
jgi:hypothetical protein